MIDLNEEFHLETVYIEENPTISLAEEVATEEVPIEASAGELQHDITLETNLEAAPSEVAIKSKGKGKAKALPPVCVCVFCTPSLHPKRRKGVLKSSLKSVTIPRVSPELPLIQEEEASARTEVFLDPCEELEPEWEEMEPGLVKSTPTVTSWADEVEAIDFQESVKVAWSKFKVNQVRTPSSQLNFTEPLKIGDQVVAKLDLEEVEVEASYWRSSIVCIFLEANPPFKVFEGFIKRIWENLGVERIVRMHYGFILASFKDEVTRDIILENEVIQFDKKLVVLRPWSEDMDTSQMIKSVPVWVRVLVDVEIKDEPPRSIAFVNEKNQLVEQQVEYEWLPTKCAACNLLGHNILNCNKEKPVAWMKKQHGDKRKNGDKDDEPGSVLLQKNNEDISVAVMKKAILNNSLEKGRMIMRVNQVRHSRVRMLKRVKMQRVGLNVKGLNKVEKQRELFDCCKINKVSFRALFETKINHDKVTSLISNNPNWKIYSSQEISYRILLIWIDKLVEVNVLLEDREMVHYKLKMVGFKEEFYLTAVYGSNMLNERKDLWNKQWIILGDFNAMFAYKDRCGGRKIKDFEIQDSQNCLLRDRWGVLYDHNYCLIKHSKTSNRGSKLFCFCNYWMFKDGYKENVLTAWRKKNITNLKSLNQQLYRINVLKNCYVSKQEDVASIYKDARELYSNAQVTLANNPHCSVAVKGEKSSYIAFQEARKQYISYLHQNSKVCWLRFGDENTSYFHSIMKKRIAENRICSYSVGGIVFDEYDKVVDHFLNHFCNFMGRQSSATRRMEHDCLDNGNKLNILQQVQITCPLNKTDVKEALFGIHSLKSQGPDGFGVGFFKGRAQLIHSVLLGVRNYWMSLFLLPQKVTTTIDKCCRDFLLGFNGNGSKMHIPSWEKVCLPEKFGGIGFREGKKWNVSIMAKYISAISSKQDNLWVRWIDAIYLKGQSFWVANFEKGASWYFKKLLQLRSGVGEDEVKEAVKRGLFGRVTSKSGSQDPRTTCRRRC
uniref:DUF4283 domain-containing protein n=1 Tax=Cannabis sativa TaxID=3483 RepID=A0A803QB93_CANSA